MGSNSLSEQVLYDKNNVSQFESHASNNIIEKQVLT
jgi:hypothetical protein